MSESFHALNSLPESLLQADEIASFAPMTFLENLEIQADGQILVTSVLDGRIWIVTPEGERRILAQVEGRLASIASRSDGGWLAFGTTVTGEGCVFAVEPDGSTKCWLKMPECVFPNGVLRLTETRYLLADSATARIWMIDYVANNYSIWLEHPLLAPLPGLPFPGLNGIKVFNGALYGTNSAQGTLIAIKLDGSASASDPQVVAQGIAADDFAFDETGAIYLTTHPFNCVIRRDSDGSVTKVAGAEEGVIGCTACRFDVRFGHETELIVITDGGLFHPPAEGILPAKIIRLKTAARGVAVDHLN